MKCVGCPRELPAHRQWFCGNACIAAWQARSGSDGSHANTSRKAPHIPMRTDCERVDNVNRCPGCKSRPGYPCPRRPSA